MTKYLEGAPLPLKDNIVLHQVRYDDRTVIREKMDFRDIVVVGLSKLCGDLRVLFSTLRIMLQHGMRPGIIHVHSANYLMSGIILKAIFRAPLCLNFGGTELVRANRIPLYRWMFRCIDKGFYVARSMEKDLFRFIPPERGVYTANGIDHEMFYPAPNTERGNDIVAVGNLRWQKDYGTLIRAFKKVCARGPSLRLIIFGDGPLRRELEALSSEFGLENKVIFMGMQPHDVIRAALQACCLYVISSQKEGFPKSLIEAMACGAPVVATDAGECRYVLEGISDVVPVGDVEALASSITHLNEDRELRGLLSERGIERSRQYSWQKVTSIVEGTYDRLLGREEIEGRDK